MAHSALLAALLLFHCLAQTPSITNPTLLQALTAKTPSNSLEGRAYLAIYESHPELENFHVDSLILSNSSPTDATCFVVHLEQAGQKTILEVSISADRKLFSVTFLTAPVRLPPRSESSSTRYAGGKGAAAREGNGTTVLSSNLTEGSSGRWDADGDEKIFLRAEFNGSLPKLGGFSPFTRYTDQRFKLALDFLTDLHPNLINYEIGEVQYQVVAGLNFLIRYTGLDKLTAIITKVNVDLKMKPTLPLFDVYCQQLGQTCQHPQAEMVFLGVETVLRKHKELTDYELVSLVVEEYSGQSMMMMVSFEHTEMSLRAISHVKMVEGREMTFSFYTYHSPA